MNVIYSKKALIIKAIYAVIVTTIYLVVSFAIEIGNPFFYLVLCALPIACLYAVPFLINAAVLRKDNKKSIRKFILLDVITLLVPAVLGILLWDFIVSYTNNATNSAGFITAIFMIIFVVITLIFWCIYLIINKIK
ncbi:MAG: hypothetical protein IKU23_07100 [Clostridia bacterium]|nr:hypothetical protein [Clostridia bacterium]